MIFFLEMMTVNITLQLNVTEKRSKVEVDHEKGQKAIGNPTRHTRKHARVLLLCNRKQAYVTGATGHLSYPMSRVTSSWPLRPPSTAVTSGVPYSVSRQSVSFYLPDPCVSGPSSRSSPLSSIVGFASGRAARLTLRDLSPVSSLNFGPVGQVRVNEF